MKSKIFFILFASAALLAQDKQSTKEKQRAIKKLHEACKRGDTSKVSRILKEKKLKINQRDVRGNSMIHHASRRNNLRMVSFLLGKSAIVNARDRAGNTALHYAASRGRIPMIKLLLRNGAAQNVANRNNDLPFHSAAISGRIKVAKYLMKRGVKNKFIRFKPVAAALDKVAKLTTSFIEKPDLVGAKFEIKTLISHLQAP